MPHQAGDRFVASFVDYMNALAAQAEARDRGGFLTVDEFLAIRQEDVGVRPVYVLEALFLSVPDHFHDDPLHERMIGLGCKLVAIDNVSPIVLHVYVTIALGMLMPVASGYAIVQPRASYGQHRLQPRHTRHAPPRTDPPRRCSMGCREERGARSPVPAVPFGVLDHWRCGSGQ